MEDEESRRVQNLTNVDISLNKVQYEDVVSEIPCQVCPVCPVCVRNRDERYNQQPTQKKHMLRKRKLGGGTKYKVYQPEKEKESPCEERKRQEKGKRRRLRAKRRINVKNEKVPQNEKERKSKSKENKEAITIKYIPPQPKKVTLNAIREGG